MLNSSKRDTDVWVFIFLSYKINRVLSETASGTYIVQARRFHIFNYGLLDLVVPAKSLSTAVKSKSISSPNFQEPPTETLKLQTLFVTDVRLM